MTQPASSTEWKHFAGEFAVLTVALAVFVVAGFITMSVLAMQGLVPLWVATITNTIFAYMAFTPAHEAAHGNVHGGHRRWAMLDELVGWACGLLLFAPFSAFRVLHLTHHSHTNDPQKDPDYWVAGGSFISIVGRCLSIMLHYYGDFLLGSTSRTRAAKKARLSTVVVLGSLLAFVAVAVGLGYGVQVSLLWLLPAVLASGMLAFAFDWMPHAPHDTQARYDHSRIVLFPGLALPMLGQNYHLIHHLYPRIPFYRYGQCFWAIRPSLEARGCQIVDLSRPLHPQGYFAK